MITQIFKAVTLSGVTSYLGPEWLDVQDAPPALIWVPTEGDFSPGQRKANTGDISKRSVGTAAVTTRVRVWTVWPKETPLPEGYDQSQADYQVLWELLERFLVALYDAAVGSVRVGRLSWLTEAGQALVEFGKACDVEVEWDIPVTRPANATAEITEVAQVGGVGPEIID